MWCPLLQIGGITRRTCERWSMDETTTCGLCRGVSIEQYPDDIPLCGCGLDGNHPGMCSYRKSFFEFERQPTEQEKTYIRARMAGLAKTKAAAVVGARISDVDTPATQRFLVQKLDEVGLTDEAIAQKIREGVEAKTVIKLRQEDGSEKMEEVEDNTNQFRFTELAVKIKGGTMDKRDVNIHGNVTIVNRFSRNTESPAPEAIDVTPVGADG